jgi:predicted lipid-binding transport protein (Tim44 family)
LAKILRIALMLLVVALAVYLAITLFFIFLIVIAIGAAYIVVMRLLGKPSVFDAFQKAKRQASASFDGSAGNAGSNSVNSQERDKHREGIIIEHESIKDDQTKP